MHIGIDPGLAGAVAILDQYVIPPQEDELDAFLREKSDRKPRAPDKSRFFKSR